MRHRLHRSSLPLDGTTSDGYILPLQLTPGFLSAVDLLVFIPHPLDLITQDRITPYTDRPACRICLPGLVLVVRGRGIGTTPQIGSTPYAAR